MILTFDALDTEGKLLLRISPNQAAAFCVALKTMIEETGAENPRLTLNGDTGDLAALWGNPRGAWLLLRVDREGQHFIESSTDDNHGHAAVYIAPEDLTGLGKSDALFALAAKFTQTPKGIN